MTVASRAGAVFTITRDRGLLNDRQVCLEAVSAQSGRERG
jgi:hypothetical protein